MPLILLFGLVWGQSEAGAIFLLIEPGASATGMGTAQVAYPQSSNMSYYNPAGLSLLQYNDVSISRVRWIPGLRQDRYHNFFSFNYILNNYSAVGGHIINLDLGEQIKTSNTGDEIGTYNIYMTAFSLSYSLLVSNNKSFGINAKLIQQQLSDFGAGEVKNDTTFTDYGFDIGYMHQEWILPDLNFGISISNLGNEITLFDDAQSDPQPTNLALGFNYTAFSNETHKLNLIFDINKLLIASYPDMDWDGDGYIGGYDNGGNLSPGGDDYNINGQLEIAHTDPLLKALYTSWFDDWLLGGDLDYGSGGPGNGDKIIGGYDWVDADGDGNADGDLWEDKNENGEIDEGEGEIIKAGIDKNDGIEFGDAGWGIYNEDGVKELGNSKDRSLSDELDRLVHNFGLEYWYGQYFAIRTGYYYDKTGKINNPTFGIGLRFAGYGFDFGYTFGEPGHPLTNTMRFSLNMEF